MAQPGAYDIYLDAGFQEVDRSAVSPDVWGDIGLNWPSALSFDYLRCIATDDFVDAEPGWAASVVPVKTGRSSVLVEPDRCRQFVEQGGRLLPKRQIRHLSPLP